MIVNQAHAGSAVGNTVQRRVSGDLTSAAAAQQSPVVDLSQVTAAISAVAALTVGTAANAQACSTALNTLNDVNQQIGQQATVLESAGLDYADPSAAVSSFQQQLSASKALASAVGVQGYLARICSTLISLD